MRTLTGVLVEESLRHMKQIEVPLQLEVASDPQELRCPQTASDDGPMRDMLVDLIVDRHGHGFVQSTIGTSRKRKSTGP